ncbi:MAG: lipopolysaccharide biosynthesis protein [Verrucomicrobiota bacterium]|nr:lipopolysaccharide biosynthesis protein [Verrucomicrobiota bacterium]
MHSAIWSITQQLVRQGLAAAFMVVIAKRLAPAEFGVLSIATIWTAFLGLFLDLGFASALVQRKEITTTHMASVLAVNVASGTILTLLSIGASWPVSWLMNAPSAQPVIAVLSLGFLVTAMGSVQNALAQRELRFKALAYRDFTASSISAVVGIIMAVQGFGVWSLVANSMLGNFLGTLLIWRLSPHRFSILQASLASAKELWIFGSRMLGYSVLKHITRNTDSIVIGMLFGPEKLGLYSFAQRVTFSPLKGIQAGLGSFLFPKAAKIQDDPSRLADLYVLSFKLLNYLLIPIAIGLLTIGSRLIPQVFGKQWEAAMPIIALLSGILFMQAACIPLGELMKATNRPEWLFRWTIFLTILTTSALFLGSYFGFEGTILAFSSSYILTAPVVAWIANQITRLRWSDFLVRTQFHFMWALITSLATAVVWFYSSGNFLAASLAVSAILIVAAFIAYQFDPDLRKIAALLPFKSPVMKMMRRVAPGFK